MELSQKCRDAKDYRQHQLNQYKQWEMRCTRCGACCGIVEGDPCEHVIELKDGRYACKIYQNRIGEHKTKSGRQFRCVPIRDILHKSWPGDSCCGYKKL